MSSDSQQLVESLQREFNAYVDHITKQAPKAKAKSKAKQVVAVETAPVIEVAAPKKRGRKPKSDEAPAVAC